MKVVILAGGMGTRLAEYTKTIPKPMVKLNGKPIIYYIMKHYANYGYKEFFLALGYKGGIIKKYFNKEKKNLSWKINLIDTGLNTMTGGRLKKLKKYLGKETFLMTYGDGVSKVNLDKLVKFHKKNKKALVTMTAVRPPARFGAIKIKGNKVSVFREKSKIDEGWINGGFFVANKKFLKFIKNDNTILEKEPLENVVKKKQLSAFKHLGFWKCMDVKRDRDELIEIYKKKNFF